MGLGDASNNSSGLHLVLGLGLTAGAASSKADNNTRPTKSSSFNFPPTSSCEPSLTLGLSGETYQVPKKIDANKSCEDPLDFSRQTSPHSHSAVSSFSSGRVKRERDLSSEEVEAADRVSSRVSDEDEDATNARKKLRLTKEQSALLEESFKQHSTLNPVCNHHQSLHLPHSINTCYFPMG